MHGEDTDKIMGQEIERALSLCNFSILKTNQEFFILTEERSHRRRKSLETRIFRRGQQTFARLAKESKRCLIARQGSKGST